MSLGSLIQFLRKADSIFLPVVSVGCRGGVGGLGTEELIVSLLSPSLSPFLARLK